MKPLRSMLFAPGNQPRMIEAAAASAADALIFDLEDLVPIDQKAEARAICREYVEKLNQDFLIYVRVNSMETGRLRDDLEAVVVAGLEGVLVPKVESPETVLAVDAMLTEIERSRGLPVGKTEISVLLETARGVRFAYEILSATPRIGSVAVGTAEDADLQTDLGYRWSIDGPETLYVRSKVLLDARAAGLDNILDGAYANFRDEAGLIAASEMARRLGFRGRELVHPCQADPVNRIFSPTARELDYYRRIVAAFDAAVARGSAYASVDGKLVDYAMIGNARKMLAWAESLAARKRRSSFLTPG